MKLRAKLILGFLSISLISIGVIVFSIRFSTNREFDKFISNQFETELAEELTRYYETNNSWENVDQTYLGLTATQFGPQEGHSSNFSVADTDGVVVLESFVHHFNDKVDRETLDKAIAIQVNNQTVGYLIIERPPARRDPMQSEFIRRIDLSLTITAIGTVLLAFIFGAILSRTITNPVHELTSATHAMANGKLGQKVMVRSRDEIGQLAESFNKMNDDLARAFNLRRQMTADIAHELRTPLSLILGHAEAVHDGVLPPTRENFEIIRDEAERLEHLVNDLRTLSLADAGELAVEFQVSDVRKLLGDVHSHYLHQFNRKEIDLSLETGGEPLQVALDSTRFTQVMTNILDNALRYTPQGGHVLISSRKAGQDVEIVIQDDGDGVSSEEAAHIFDRFYRADPSRTRDEGGSGLGLAIAKSIIEMHRGTVWAESEKGGGMRVIIHLPLAK